MYILKAIKSSAIRYTYNIKAHNILETIGIGTRSKSQEKQAQNREQKKAKKRNLQLAHTFSLNAFLQPYSPYFSLHQETNQDVSFILISCPTIQLTLQPSLSLFFHCSCHEYIQPPKKRTLLHFIQQQHHIVVVNSASCTSRQFIPTKKTRISLVVLVDDGLLLLRSWSSSRIVLVFIGKIQKVVTTRALIYSGNLFNKLNNNKRDPTNRPFQVWSSIIVVSCPFPLLCKSEEISKENDTVVYAPSYPPLSPYFDFSDALLYYYYRLFWFRVWWILSCFCTPYVLVKVLSA